MPLILVIFNSALSEEIAEYFSLLCDFRNPVFFSIFTALLLIAIFLLAMRNTVLPQQKKILLEKSQIESRNIRLMAIFAELDPDPVLRINHSGEIIFINPAARSQGLEQLIGKPVSNILPALDIEPEVLIKENKESVLDFYFSDRYYSVLVKGISYLDIAQVYMHDVTELKLKEKELKNSQTELKEFSRYLQEQIEDERKRIARELHDDIGQKLVLLKLGLQKDMSSLDIPEDSHVFQKNSRLIEDISRDVKTIAHSLIPSTLEEIGLYSSLIKLIETVDLQSSVNGSLDFIDIEGRLDLKLEISIYRIIQEAVNNIVKHSKANEFSIQLIKKHDALRLLISDDGMGFNSRGDTQSRGMGIRNMKERAEIHGGTFKISSSPMEGTIIMINFPLENLNYGQ
ncbi:MAG: ATP-binding protein [Ignavibacteriales bacterium]